MEASQRVTQGGVPPDLGMEEGAENVAISYWRAANTSLQSLCTSLKLPMNMFGKIWTDDYAVMLIGCCCFWIPLYAAYLLLAASIFCVGAGIAAIFGIALHLTCLIVGIVPGILMALSISAISIGRIPWNFYLYCLVTHRSLVQGRFLQATTYMLLLPPVQLLLPLLVSLASAGCVLVTGSIAFMGFPQHPWVNLGPVVQAFWRRFVTEMSDKVSGYCVVAQSGEGDTASTMRIEIPTSPTVSPIEDISDATQYWILGQDFLSQLAVELHRPIRTLQHLGVLTKDLDLNISSGIIMICFPVWLSVVLCYFIGFVAILCAVTVSLITIGITQALVFLSLGVWPGFIFAIGFTAISVVRTPWNIYYHCLVTYRSVRQGKIIKTVGCLFLLPIIQLLLPILALPVSVCVGPLSCGAIAFLGFPQVLWIKISVVHRQVWKIFTTDMGTKVDAMCQDDAVFTEENYLVPYWSAVAQLLSTIVELLGSPGSFFQRTLRHQNLLFWLSFVFWIPIVIAYGILSIVIVFAVTVPFIVIGIALSILFLSLGIWPGFIIAISVTVISTVRIPWNIFYHCLITYRTILLRRNLKLISFLLVPPVHCIVPVVVAVCSFGGCVPTCAMISLIGTPQRAWAGVWHVPKKFWKRYVTDVEAHVNNFGHESGIPDNWDGRIYGLPLDPLTIVMSILLYLYAVLPVSIGVIGVLLIQAFPIVMQSVVEFWKFMNFIKVFINWGKIIVEWASVNPSTKFATILKEYFLLVKTLKPVYICESANSYSKEFNLFECIPKNSHCCEIVCLLPAIIGASVFWVLGFLMVTLATVSMFVISVVCWVLGWAVVVALPPAVYILAWLGLLLLLPAGYTAAWILLLALSLLWPWPCLAVSMLSGPFLALEVPFIVLKLNLLNPSEMDQSFKLGLKKPLLIVKETDRQARKFSVNHWSIFTHPEEPKVETAFHTDFDYWKLFRQRATQQISWILAKHWMTEDSIAEASATAMVAIPGCTVLEVLADSVEKEGTDKSLIYWSEEAQCTHRRRNRRDNISNHFFPLLLKIKGQLRELKHLKKAKVFISASLCDGDDYTTEELKVAVNNPEMSAEEKKTSLKARSEIENLVHSLLRVKKVQEVLSKICQKDYNTISTQPESHIVEIGETVEMVEM